MNISAILKKKSLNPKFSHKCGVLNLIVFWLEDYFKGFWQHGKI